MTLGPQDNMEGSYRLLPNGWWCIVPHNPHNGANPKPRLINTVGTKKATKCTFQH